MSAKSPDPAPYRGLTPDVVLDAVESFGLRCSGSILGLNSYENRVYQIGLDEGGFIVAKFYRPGRWSDDAILEEHAFSQQLQAREIPVVAPLEGPTGVTLCRHREFRFAVFPRCGGREPPLEVPEHLVMLGRFIARIHALGAVAPFEFRPALTVDSFGHRSAEFLRESEFIPMELRESYASVVRDVLVRVEAAFQRAGPVPAIRIHGDCHPGNLLWTDAGPHFVDLDDCRMGPPVQDLWMLMSGPREEMALQIEHILTGYMEFFDFEPRQLQLIEALRALRMIHYSAWLARRWHDPAFPINFPWFASPRYWEEQILALREQMAVLDEPPLPWPF